jgi:hypothetical protein
MFSPWDLSKLALGHAASLSGVAALIVVLVATPVAAQVAPPLGVSQQFGVLANSAVTGSTGVGAVVNGDVGSSPNPAISNFPPSRTVLPFIVHRNNDGVVQQARIDATAAYVNMVGQGPGTVLADNLGGGVTLTSGIYSFATGSPDLPAGNTLTLNGGGVFIFNVGAALTANVNSVIAGTANPCNIFWRIGTSATLNGVNFRGTVIADASITIGSGSHLEGRALAGTGPTGAVTIAGGLGNAIGGCSSPETRSDFCPAISILNVPNAPVGVFYSTVISVTAGTPPFTFTLVNSNPLPPGLTLGFDGLLSGTPTASGRYEFSIRGTDSFGCFGQANLVMLVGEGVPVMPQPFMVVLAIGLAGLGYARLRRRSAR